MAEKMGKPPPLTMGSRPVPMKFFATWEVDRTPSNCIPRLCSLTLSRLVLFKSLGSDLNSIIIAVKMQSSKRTLRSNELMLPPSGLLDTELELHFSLQYPHFIKRDDTNRLLVMLQRRKRYKNRTILGFKTLAEGTINMSQVLQRQMDVELELMAGESSKDSKREVVARVSVLALSSQPVDHEEAGLRHKRLALSDNTDRAAADFSDDDEEFCSSNEEGSDSEPMLEDAMGPRRSRKPSRAKIPATARQRNLKQKFISLLKRFRVSEDLENDQEEIDQKLASADMDPTDIADLFDELEDMSDSGPEMDTMSISSTPKPSLRPFFSSSRSLVQPESGLAPPITGEALGATSPSSALQHPLHSLLHRSNGHHSSSHHHQGTSKVAFRERGSDRQSDESSKKADSDSHPENWTDHEHSDPQQSCIASSPPHAPLAQSESLEKTKESGDRDRRSRLFARDRTVSGSKTKKETPRTPNSAPEQLGGPVHTESSPRKALLEQLSRLLPPDDGVLPDHVVLVSAGEGPGAALAARLSERQQRVFSIAGVADVRATITCLISKIQKFCNSSAKPPAPVKVLIAGPDSLISCVMRQYVEQLSTKPPDWQSHLRFLVVPLGGSGNSLARYLSSVDSMYAASFSGEGWRDLVDRLESKTECQEALTRMQRYLVAANSPLPLPVAEAMITYKEKSSDEESSQVFIPFINEVRLGSTEMTSTASVDLDENQLSPPVLHSSGSPPSTAGLTSPASQQSAPEKRITPPSSPNVNTSYIQSPRWATALWDGLGMMPSEPMELQLDYWLLPTSVPTPQTIKGEQPKSKPDSNKCTLKTTFRALQVHRLPQLGATPAPQFIMSYTTKESKKKTPNDHIAAVMRLGKKKEKEKESEPKNQQIEGVTRLICSAKTHNMPLKVSIDGMEWNGVKFFQLSAQWQTHIRNFPIALFNVPDPGSC